MSDDSPTIQQSTLKQIADDEPQRHDVFVGLVAPLGSSTDDVVIEVPDTLTAYGYAAEHVHLAGFLDSAQPSGGPALPERDQPHYFARDENRRRNARRHDPQKLNELLRAAAERLSTGGKTIHVRVIEIALLRIACPRRRRIPRSRPNTNR